jgi:hypothetical protein
MSEKEVGNNTKRENVEVINIDKKLLKTHYT